MAEVNRISSFKTFSEIKSQKNEIKIREENQTKKKETLSRIEEILDEMGLSDLSELDEESQNGLITKILGKDTSEGNAFIYAASKAKQDGNNEFEFQGKTYKVTLKKDTGLNESEVTEGAVKRFEMDLEDMIKDIKRGYGWIDPEFVADTWENTSDSIDFEFVKAEIYKRLIAAGLLAYADKDNEEEAGKYVKNLKELGIKESIVIEEGTRGQFGKIDKAGNITSVYMHHDSYPENILPIIKQSFKGGKNVDVVISKGNNSGLDKNVDAINYYNDKSAGETGNVKKIDNYLKTASDDSGAEYVYLWDEGSEQWMMADIYKETGLVPAFESVVTEARPGTKTYYQGRDVLPPHYGNSELHDKSEEMFKKSWKKLNDKQQDEVLSSFPKNESVVTEAKFFRLPKQLNAMWELKNSVDYMVGKHDAGDDYKPADMKTIEEFIKKIKQSAKAFKDAEEVKGTVYESVVTEGKLKRGDKITIEFDDEDGDYKAGEYTVIGGSKGGKELEGMGIKIFMTDRELNSIEYTVKESVVTEARFNYKETGLSGQNLKDVKDGITGIKNALKRGNESAVISNYDLVQQRLQQYGGPKASEFLEKIKQLAGLDESIVTEAKIKVTKKDIKDIEDSGNIDIAYKKAMALLTSLVESVVTEASGDLKVGDHGIDYNDNVVEIIAIGRFAKIAKMFKKETKEDAEDSGFKELMVNTDYYLTKNIESPEGNVGDFAMYPVRYDMANYWGLDPLDESVITEAEINTDEEFKEYAFTVLKKAFQKDFDEDKANDVVDGILTSSEGDYGVAIGMLVKSLG